MTSSEEGTEALRRLLASAFVDEVRGIDVAAAVARALPRRAHAGGRGRVRVVALGKASAEMAAGALSAWSIAPRDALVVVPDGAPVDALPPGVTVLRGSHPVPDARSVEAARACLAFVRSRPGDVVLALVSGGASALVSAPRGVDLATKAELVATLLRSGAPIEALNAVRRHLSWIKGGGLARAAAPAAVLSLVLSDVLHGALHDIASGPTVADPTDVGVARAALLRYAPRFADVPLRPTLRPGSPAARRVHARVVLGPGEVAASFARRLTGLGLAAQVLPPAADDVELLADAYVAHAARLAPGAAIVRAAEPTIVVAPGAGRGGRSSHLAARIASRLPPGVAFLAGATDGVDGASAAAGAAVSAASFADVGPAAVASFVALFDTATLHERAGTALHLGPTGRNFADLHVLARAVR